MNVSAVTADSHGRIVFTDTNPLSGAAFYRTIFP
jgi:hypothetical protein